MAEQMVQEMRTARGKRTAYMRRWSALKANRSPLIAHWHDLTTHILPRSGRFFTSDKDRGGAQSYNDIYDNTGTLAHGVLSAGMMAGVTSPAQRWFKLTTANPALAKSHGVRLWLDEVEELIALVFTKSNFYDTTHALYEDLSTFGTAAMLVLPDFDNIIHCYPLAIGEFCLQQDYKGRVTTLYRECQKSVGEVVKEFGEENCSTQVQQQYRAGELESQVDLLHVIEPRSDRERDMRSPLNRDMPWKSVYLEQSGTDEKLLRESGFQIFPLLAPRWRVNGGDVYGTSPGMTALGDIRQLQREQLDKGRAIAFQAQPPLQVPTSMKDREQDGQPGGQSYVEPAQVLPFDQVTPSGGIRSAFEVTLDLNHLVTDIADVRDRINRAFHVDLFLMIASAAAGDTQRTKYEVQQLLEEKLMILGPALQRVDHEFLRPVVDIVFHEMTRAGALPPAPPELEGQNLSVEFVGMLAQAQKAVGSASEVQFIAEVLQVAEKVPEILDKLNFDKWVDNHARRRGIPAELIVDDEAVKALRQARGRAQAMAEQAQVGAVQAGAVKDLAASPTNQPNALTGVMRALRGEAIPA